MNTHELTHTHKKKEIFVVFTLRICSFSQSISKQNSSCAKHTSLTKAENLLVAIVAIAHRLLPAAMIALLLSDHGHRQPRRATDRNALVVVQAFRSKPD